MENMLDQDAVITRRERRANPLRRRIALVGNTSWFLYNFRARLMSALRDHGHEVVVIAPEDDFTQRIRDAGFAYRAVHILRTGMNPFEELRAIIGLRRVLARERPDVVLSFTPKGNIYTSIATIGLPLDLIPTISGLGRIFVGQSWRQSLVTSLYRAAMRRARNLFIENEDDVTFFTDVCGIDKAKCTKIPGLGVDLERFVPPKEEPSTVDGPVFLLIARLLWEKGIGQYAEAAAVLRKKYPQARFQVLGPYETDNESAIPPGVIEEWVSAGAIEYLGVTTDVRGYIRPADCIVLPSYYREGVPRSILESAAMGKAVITTDMPGCRTAVEHGVTGYLCRPKDTADLIDKLETFIRLSAVERRALGRNARIKMEREFDETAVIARYLDCVAPRDG